ncbi:MAG: amidase [Gammaproteobacteria bacterium]
MARFNEYESFDGLGLAGLVASGEVTPSELLEEALARVEALNPSLNAIATLQPETARSLIDTGPRDGAFEGVPFLLKDLGAEAKDFPSNSGSHLFAGTRYPFDSALYSRLRRAGLVTFGRTTSPELGIGPVTEAQIYGGPTRNPWNTGHTPGGSSGGAGACVAAGVLPAAHGSDGGGSVRIPASCNGLYGLKPTRARLPDGPASGEGWGGMAVDGFLTRSVRDTAALLDATVGADAGAPYWAPPLSATFTAAMSRQPGPLKMLYSTRSFTGEAVHPECCAAVESAAALCTALGHRVEEAAPTIEVDDLMLAWCKIVACGTALAVQTKVDSRGQPVQCEEIEGVTRGACELANSISGAQYLQALNTVHRFGRQMAAWFEECDVFVTPVLAEPPAAIGRFKPDNDDFLDYRLGPQGIFPYSPFAAPFNASGQPAASVPLHWTADGLPVGVQFAAAFGADELLIALSAQLEQARPWFDRRPPLCERRQAREQ